MKQHFHKFTLLATTLLLALAAHATETSLKAEFTVLKRFPLAGEGGWDYLTVDAPHHHLFISRSTHVQVMDTNTGALVGDILNTPGVHGIALAPQFDKGFISNGRDNSVTVISLSTLATLNKIATPEGKKPDFIFFEPSTEDVYVFNGQSNNATVIDAKTDQIKGTVALSGKPEAAVSDLNGSVYVALEDKNAVAKIKQSTLLEAAVFKVPHCDEPAGLAISQTTKELFVGCHNKGLYLVDSQTGKTLSKSRIGEDVDADAFDGKINLVFTSQADSTFTVTQYLPKSKGHSKLKAKQTLITPKGSKTLAYDPEAQLIYLVSAQFESVKNAEGVAKKQVIPNSAEVLVIGAQK